MPTLKEIKGRIGSVKSTLKITSAMKLVSSAKLRKAQTAIEAMRPYEAQLQRMLSLVSVRKGDAFSGASALLLAPENASPSDAMGNASASRPTAIVAIASNSSLCGGFNANVIAQVRAVRKPGDVVYAVGRKMADAMRKEGFPSPEDLNALSEHPAYAPAAQLVEQLAQDVAEGRFGQVLLVYTHFVSTARQVPVVEVLVDVREGDTFSGASAFNSATEKVSLSVGAEDVRANAPEREPLLPDAIVESSSLDAIIEPSARALREMLAPKVLKLKLFAALLDSAAAEHAARTVAMQTATDNAEQLLDELTLQYNKGRQQKITNEILDLAGGQQD